MDREISPELKRKRKLKKILTIGLPIVLVAAAIAVILSVFTTGIKRSSIDFITADRGTVETSADASGKVVPAYEITITSPVTTKILEIYCYEGDAVEPGQSLMKLDLASEETELQKLADEKLMREYDTQQSELASRTFLTNLEMQIKAKEMSVARLKTEAANERHLDSIGSGTGDKVREADLAYRTAQLELDQLRKQLHNETLSHAASHKTKKLEEGISAKNLEEKRRTLEDAQVKAPAKATITFLNSSLGTAISAGERLAVLSDLNHFKILAQIPESNVDKLALGADVNVRVGKQLMHGRIGTITPQSNNGIVSFTVLLDDDSDKSLRSGIRADINVLFEVKEDIVRIPNGTYYHGPGSYRLFVDNNEGYLEQRDVILGEGNFDFVEVKAGLNPGDKIVKNDLSEYESSKKLKLK